MVYYHYTSTKNAQDIKNECILKKGYENIVLTTLDPEKHSRNDILFKVYGRNYDRYKFGNRADWVVIVDAKLDLKKLRKKCDDVYDYPDDIPVRPENVIDKPSCIIQGKKSSTENGMYHLVKA